MAAGKGRCLGQERNIEVIAEATISRTVTEASRNGMLEKAAMPEKVFAVHYGAHQTPVFVA